MLTSKQKSEWVAALRSGEYQQGRGRLEHDGKFCCLGVLAKINGLSTEGYVLSQENDVVNLSVTAGSYTPAGNFHYCGIPSIGFNTHIGSTATSFSEANDMGRSFTQIADHIEQHLPTKD